MSRQTRIGIFLTVAILLATFSFYGYQVVFTPNFLTKEKAEARWLYIPNGATFPQVMDSIDAKGLADNPVSFAFLAKLLGYQEKPLPGAYLIPVNSSNKTVLGMLKGGRQTPIRLTFNNLRVKGQLLELLDKKLTLNRLDLEAILQNPDSTRALFGMDTSQVVSLFIPNTYEVYWNASARTVLKKLYKGYQAFWTEKRLAQAKAEGLSPFQVSILASITEAETKKADEMPTVAGVYKNRFRLGMKLQADPTVIFAKGDYSIKRVAGSLLFYDSPYNTYQYAGLPPGPIGIPSSAALQAVLEPTQHQYLYFCAKEDFSGYHNFAVDYASHMQNAAKYQQALNRAGIK